MAHSRNGKSRRIPRIDKEGSLRTTTRTALRHGDWDNMPSTLATRSLRRASL